MDQANSLRSMMGQRPARELIRPEFSSRVITITSGKGGVGKTNFAVNLGIYLAKHNKRVVIIDADFGLANIELLFGIVPRYSLGEVVRGEMRVEEVITKGPSGVQFISGGSGLRELANVNERQLAFLMENFLFLDSLADVILIDTGAGISRTVMNFIKASRETIIVTTPEPTSITDAYALIKTVNEETGDLPDFKLVVNRVEEAEEGAEAFRKLNMVSRRFLQIGLEYLGSIPYDKDLIKSVKKQQPALLLYPQAAFSHSLESIGNKILDLPQQNKQGILLFMKKLVNIFGN